MLRGQSISFVPGKVVWSRNKGLEEKHLSPAASILPGMAIVDNGNGYTAQMARAGLPLQLTPKADTMIAIVEKSPTQDIANGEKHAPRRKARAAEESTRHGGMRRRV
jgi:hypothetical protein